MPRVGLIHSNDEFSELLASLATERSHYTVDNYSIVRPPRERAIGVLLNHFEPLTEGYDLLQRSNSALKAAEPGINVPILHLESKIDKAHSGSPYLAKRHLFVLKAHR